MVVNGCLSFKPITVVIWCILVMNNNHNTWSPTRDSEKAWAQHPRHFTIGPRCTDADNPLSRRHFVNAGEPLFFYLTQGLVGYNSLLFTTINGYNPYKPMEFLCFLDFSVLSGLWPADCVSDSRAHQASAMEAGHQYWFLLADGGNGRLILYMSSLVTAKSANFPPPSKILFDHGFLGWVGGLFFDNHFLFIVEQHSFATLMCSLDGYDWYGYDISKSSN